MPLARDPYFYPHRDQPENEEEEDIREEQRNNLIPQGRYYHPKKFAPISYEELFEETRDQNHAFPCYCKVCVKYKTLTTLDHWDIKWNRFRRIHDILCKNIELGEIRASKVAPHQALSDMFSRTDSTRLAWTKHIPTQPVYAFKLTPL